MDRADAGQRRPLCRSAGPRLRPGGRVPADARGRERPVPGKRELRQRPVVPVGGHLGAAASSNLSGSTTAGSTRDSTACEWPTSRRAAGELPRPGSGAASAGSSKADSRDCVAPGGEGPRVCRRRIGERSIQPTPSPGRQDPRRRSGSGFEPDRLRHSRTSGLSDAPFNLDYAFRAGIFAGDYERGRLSEPAGRRPVGRRRPRPGAGLLDRRPQRPRVGRGAVLPARAQPVCASSPTRSSTASAPAAAAHERGGRPVRVPRHPLPAGLGVAAGRALRRQPFAITAARAAAAALAAAAAVGLGGVRLRRGQAGAATAGERARPAGGRPAAGLHRLRRRPGDARGRARAPAAATTGARPSSAPARRPRAARSSSPPGPTCSPGRRPAARDLEQRVPAGRRLAGTRVGEETLASQLDQRLGARTSRHLTIAWRQGAVVAALQVTGFRVSPAEALALARRQQERIVKATAGTRARP